MKIEGICISTDQVQWLQVQVFFWAFSGSISGLCLLNAAKKFMKEKSSAQTER